MRDCINHSYLVQAAVYLFICSLLHQKMVLKFVTWDGRRLRDSECGVLVEWHWQVKTEVSVLMPLCTPQISNGLYLGSKQDLCD